MKPRANWDAMQLMVAVAKGRGKGTYPLALVPPHTDHIKVYIANLVMT